MHAILMVNNLSDIHTDVPSEVGLMFLSLLEKKGAHILFKGDVLKAGDGFQAAYPPAMLEGLFAAKLLAYYEFNVQFYDRLHAEIMQVFSATKVAKFYQGFLACHEKTGASGRMLAHCCPKFDEVQIEINENVTSMLRDPSRFLTDVPVGFNVDPTVADKVGELVADKAQYLAEDLMLLAYLNPDLDLDRLKLSSIDAITLITKLKQKFSSLSSAVKTIFMMAEQHYHQCSGVYFKMLEAVGNELMEKYDLALNASAVKVILDAPQVGDYLKSNFASIMQQLQMNFFQIFSSVLMEPEPIYKFFLAHAADEQPVQLLQNYLVENCTQEIALKVAQRLLRLSAAPRVIEHQSQGIDWWFNVAEKVYVWDKKALKADIDAYIELRAADRDCSQLQAIMAARFPGVAEDPEGVEVFFREMSRDDTSRNLDFDFPEAE